MSLSPPDRLAGAPLRVGYVLKKYPRLSETFVLNELLGLEQMGIEVSVFSTRLPTDGRFHPELARFRGPVTYLPEFGSSATLSTLEVVGDGRVDPAGLQRAIRFVRLLPEARRTEVLLQGIALADAANAAGIDHLHAHFATVAAHTAHVAHLCGGPTYSVTAHAKDVWRVGVDRSVFAEVADAARAVVTVCEPARAHVGSELAPGASVVKIYNGFPLEELPPTPPSRRERALVLAVGRLVEKKGFDVLVEACGRLRRQGIDVETVIVGDGDDAEALAAQIGRRGLEGQVRLAGSLPRVEILELMRRARVLAAPFVTGSDGNQDALPTVLVEAMACALPVVTTPIGGVPEMVTHGHEGLLVGEGDADALADAIARVLADDALAERLGRAGPQTVAERFDRRRTLPELVSVFDGSHPELSRELVASALGREAVA